MNQLAFVLFIPVCCFNEELYTIVSSLSMHLQVELRCSVDAYDLNCLTMV